MRKLKLIFTCLLMVSISFVNAQTKTASGTVISTEDGLPVIGASVIVKDDVRVGVITDENGKYSLSVPASAQTLMISSVGMKNIEVPALPDQRVSMETDVSELKEVMVVAYGIAKRESFTGSAEVVKGDKLARRPISNVTKALDGAVAGVQSTSGSGQPGSGASVIIRGFGSINSSIYPLYVVDGVPYGGSIAAINPNDIESMTVLKDASAGALYGARGANGVIIVTTKKGDKDGKVKVNIKANWGVASRAVPRYETMDEAGYLETIFQSYKNNEIINNGVAPDVAGTLALNAMKSGTTAMLGLNEQYNPFNYEISELIDPITGKVRSDAKLRYSEDWLDNATKKNPLRQEYDISFSGNANKSTYLLSLGYVDEQGLLITTKFNRYSGRLNVETEVNKWLKTGMSGNYSRNQSNLSVENDTQFSNIWYTAQLMAPIFPIYEKDAEGQTVLDNLGKSVFDYGINRPAGAVANWNSIATLYDDKYSSASDNLTGRIFAEIGDLKTGIIRGLKLRVNYGFDLINSTRSTYYNPFNGNAVGTKGKAEKVSARTFVYTFNQTMQYDRKFYLHHVDALVGHEFYKYNDQYLSAGKTGFPFGGLYELDAATTQIGASSYIHNYAVESIFSRLNYDYDDKYYLSFSYRTDGSSRFYKDNQWGQFWSVGANWRISEESFMQSIDWVNNLSLKASYGIQGNDALGTFYAWQSFYDLGYPNALMSGAIVTSLENKDLRWEKNANLNVGVETKVFDRIHAIIEFYERTTKDMLLNYPMASSLGFDGYDKNVGSMKNTGLDITLGTDIFKSQNFNWRLNLIGSTIKNKVITLADKPEIINGSYIIKEGEVFNSFYTASSAGVDPTTGKQLYWVWDTDEDGVKGEKYISDDATKALASTEIQGNRIPDLYGSIGNEFKYKGFDLNILLTYSLGGKILDGVYYTLLYGNYVGQARSKHLERAWKKPGDITDIPRIEIGKNYIITDNDLINASYLSVKNVTLGYTLSAKYSNRIGVESIRFTATGDNLYLFTHLVGMNPQFNFSGGTNFEYVPTRNISFGIDIKL